jgi:hypothetical protein
MRYFVWTVFLLTCIYTRTPGLEGGKKRPVTFKKYFSPPPSIGMATSLLPSIGMATSPPTPSIGMATSLPPSIGMATPTLGDTPTKLAHNVPYTPFRSQMEQKEENIEMEDRKRPPFSCIALPPPEGTNTVEDFYAWIQKQAKRPGMKRHRGLWALLRCKHVDLFQLSSYGNLLEFHLAFEHDSPDLADCNDFLNTILQLSNISVRTYTCERGDLCLWGQNPMDLNTSATITGFHDAMPLGVGLESKLKGALLKRIRKELSIVSGTKPADHQATDFKRLIIEPTTDNRSLVLHINWRTIEGATLGITALMDGINTTSVILAENGRGARITPTDPTQRLCGACQAPEKTPHQPVCPNLQAHPESFLHFKCDSVTPSKNDLVYEIMGITLLHRNSQSESVKLPEDLGEDDRAFLFESLSLQAGFQQQPLTDDIYRQQADGCQSCGNPRHKGKCPAQARTLQQERRLQKQKRKDLVNQLMAAKLRETLSERGLQADTLSDASKDELFLLFFTIREGGCDMWVTPPQFLPNAAHPLITAHTDLYVLTFDSKSISKMFASAVTSVAPSPAPLAGCTRTYAEYISTPPLLVSLSPEPPGCPGQGSITKSLA